MLSKITVLTFRQTNFRSSDYELMIYLIFPNFTVSIRVDLSGRKV